MTTPDAEDASPSPECSGDPDGSDMGELKVEAHADDASPSQKTANGHKPSSNAKDPLRPRRKKARRACFACQRAHLTCGDERPCQRCVKRGLQDHCMDGVRKKAKYLHDAPDGALIPGVGNTYPRLNGGHPVGLPVQDQNAGSLPQQGGFYNPAPSGPYYGQNPAHGQVPVAVQEASTADPFSNPQAPISPPYSQTTHGSIATVPNTVPHSAPSQMQQFGGPLFDPSDPALFNFDISSLNFGNHYGALELGMLGHMSSGAAETPPQDSHLMNPLNQAAGIFNPQVPSTAYADNGNVTANISLGHDGLPQAEWQTIHSRQGSIQIQTPNNTPTTATLEHGSYRQDSLSGPPAYAIGQGPSSLSSASPASTDMNSVYDNDNPMSAAAFFANAGQQQQHPPAMARHHPNGHTSRAVIPPGRSQVGRKRRRDTRWIYEEIDRPYDYVGGWHRLFLLMMNRYPVESIKKVQASMGRFRPVLVETAAQLSKNDLIYQEKCLQIALVINEDHFLEVGVPTLLCRRSGEVVGLNQEFSILTGWTRSILLGKEPNMNVNIVSSRDASDESGLSTRTSTSPVLSGQEQSNGPFPVSILELMDERSAIEWVDDFSDVAYLDSRGTIRRRVNMVRYMTKEDVANAEERRSNAKANGRHPKLEPLIKLESGPYQHGESAMRELGSKDGLIDCMIMWHIKRDTFDEPMLVCMHVMPVLDKPQTAPSMLERTGSSTIP